MTAHGGVGHTTHTVAAGTAGSDRGLGDVPLRAGLGDVGRSSASTLAPGAGRSPGPWSQS